MPETPSSPVLPVIPKSFGRGKRPSPPQLKPDSAPLDQPSAALIKLRNRVANGSGRDDFLLATDYSVFAGLESVLCATLLRKLVSECNILISTRVPQKIAEAANAFLETFTTFQRDWLLLNYPSWPLLSDLHPIFSPRQSLLTPVTDARKRIMNG